MTVEDYDQLHALWMRIKGFGIRSIDDSKEGVERFLKRNPLIFDSSFNSSQAKIML